MAKMAETTERLCPACGCQLGGSPYKKGGLLYCCEPCANGGPCECGCCKVEEHAGEKE